MCPKVMFHLVVKDRNWLSFIPTMTADLRQPISFDSRQSNAYAYYARLQHTIDCRTGLNIGWTTGIKQHVTTRVMFLNASLRIFHFVFAMLASIISIFLLNVEQGWNNASARCEQVKCTYPILQYVTTSANLDGFYDTSHLFIL